MTRWLLFTLILALLLLLAGGASAQTYCANREGATLRCQHLATSNQCDLAGSECLWNGSTCLELSPRLECRILPTQQACGDFADYCYWYDSFLYYGACFPAQGAPTLQCADLKTNHSCQWMPDCYWDGSESRCKSFFPASFTCDALDARTVCGGAAPQCYWESTIDNLTVSMTWLQAPASRRGIAQLNITVRNTDALAFFSGWQINTTHDLHGFEYTNASEPPIETQGEYELWAVPALSPGDSFTLLVNYTMWQTGNIPFKLYMRNPGEEHLFSMPTNITVVEGASDVIFFNNLSGSNDLAQDVIFGAGITNNGSARRDFELRLGFDPADFRSKRATPLPDHIEDGVIAWNISLDPGESFRYNLTGYSYDGTDILFETNVTDVFSLERYRERFVASIDIIPYCAPVDWKRQLSCYDITNETICATATGCFWYYGCQELMSGLTCQHLSDRSSCGATSDICYWTPDGRRDPPTCEVKNPAQPFRCEAITTPDICLEKLNTHCTWTGSACITLASDVSCALLDDYPSCVQSAGLCYWSGPLPTSAFEIMQSKEKLTVRVNATTRFNISIQSLELDSKIVNVTYLYSTASLSLLSAEVQPDVLEGGRAEYHDVNITSFLRYSFLFQGVQNATYETVVIVTYGGRNYTSGMTGKVENPIYPNASLSTDGLRSFNNSYYLRGLVAVAGNATGQEFANWTVLAINQTGSSIELCSGSSVLVGTFCLLDTRTLALGEGHAYRLRLVAKNLDGNNATAELYPVYIDNSAPRNDTTLALSASASNPSYDLLSAKLINATANFTEEHPLRAGVHFTDLSGDVLFYRDLYNTSDQAALLAAWGAAEYTLAGQQVSAQVRNTSASAQALLVPGSLRANATAGFARYGGNFSQWYLAYNTTTGEFLGVTQDSWCTVYCTISTAAFEPYNALFRPYRYLASTEGLSAQELSQVQLYTVGDAQNPRLMAQNCSQIGAVYAIAEDRAGNQRAISASTTLDNGPPSFQTVAPVPTVINSVDSTLRIGARFLDSDLQMAFVNTTVLGVPACPQNVTLVWNGSAWDGSCDLGAHVASLSGARDIILPVVACDQSRNCRPAEANITLVGRVSTTPPSACYRVDALLSTNLSAVPSFAQYNYTIALQANESCLGIGQDAAFKESHRLTFINVQGGRQQQFELLTNLSALLVLRHANKTSGIEPFVALDTNLTLPFERLEVIARDLPYLGKPVVEISDRAIQVNPDAILWTSEYRPAQDMYFGEARFNAAVLGNFSFQDRQAPMTNATIQVGQYGTLGAGLFQNTSAFSLPIIASDLHSAIDEVVYAITNVTNARLQNGSSKTTPGLCSFANVTANCSITWTAPSEGVYSLWLNISDYGGELLPYRIYFIYDHTPPAVNQSTLADITYSSRTNISYNISFSERPYVFYFANFTVTNSTGARVFQDIAYNFTVNDSIILPAIDGNYTLNISMADRAGNRNQTAKMLVLDTIAPAVVAGQDTMGRGHYARDHIYASYAQADLYPGSVTLALFNPQHVLIHQESCVGQNCTINRTGLAEGVYSLQVTATDQAGNQNITEISDIVLDLTPPRITLFYVTPSSGGTYDGSRAYEFTAQSDGANDTAALILDGVAYNATPLPGGFHRATLLGIAAGNHTYYWRIVDLAGNTRISSNFSYTLQRVTPQLGINAGATYAYDDAYNITGTGCPAQLSCEFLIDGSLSNASVVQGLGAGNHTIEYRTDGNANYTAAAAQRNISIAKGNNSVFISVASQNGSIIYLRPGTYDVAATALAGGSLALSIDGAPAAAGINTVSASYLFDQDRTYAASAAVQETPNHHPANTSADIIIDSRAPVASLNLVGGQLFNSTDPRIAYTILEQHFLRYDATLSNATMSYNASGTESAGNLTFAGVRSGDYDLRFVALDRAGNNHSLHFQNLSFDIEPPQINVTGLARDRTHYTKDRSLSFGYSVADAHFSRSRVEIRADGRAVFEQERNQSSGSVSLADLAIGNYSVRVIGIDTYGNRGSFDATIIVDDAPPQVIVEAPLNNSEGGGSRIELRYTVIDPFYNYSRARLFTHNGSFVGEYYSYARDTGVLFPVSVPAEGYYDVHVTVYDLLDNEVAFSVENIYREWTVPSVTMELLPPSSTKAQHNISCYAIDEYGIAMMGVEVYNSTGLVLRHEQPNNQAGIARAVFPITLPGEDRHTIRCVAADAHLNNGSSANQTLLYSEDPLRIGTIAAALDYSVILMDHDPAAANALFANIFLPSRFKGANVTWSSAEGAKLYTDPMLQRGVRGAARGAVRLTANISLPYASMLKDYTLTVGDTVSAPYSLTNSTYTFKTTRKPIAPTRQLLATNATYVTTGGDQYLDLAFYPLIEYSPTATRLNLTPQNASMILDARAGTTSFEVIIPEGTTINSTSYWNGMFKLPKPVNKTFGHARSTAFEIGSGAPMNLSTEVTITVRGIAPYDHAAWVDFEGLPHPIPSCPMPQNATDCFEILAPDAMRITTRHLTLFILYTDTVVTGGTSSGGGGGGGGAGGAAGGGGNVHFFTNKTPENKSEPFAPRVYELTDSLRIRERIGVPFILVAGEDRHVVVYTILSAEVTALVDGVPYERASPALWKMDDCSLEEMEGMCDFSVVAPPVVIAQVIDSSPKRPGMLARLSAHYHDASGAVLSWVRDDGTVVVPLALGAVLGAFALTSFAGTWYRKNRVMMRLELSFLRLKRPRVSTPAAPVAADTSQEVADRVRRRKEIEQRLSRLQQANKR